MSVIGMDISSNRIAVTEVIRKRRNFYINNAAVFDVPRQVIEKGEIKDTRVVSNAVSEVWNHYGFRSKKVLVGLSNPKVIIKEIKLPVTSDAEIESSIKLQINDLVPITKDNISYDYFVIEKGDEYSRIMIAGAAKNMIDSIVESLRNIKINPLSIDLNCFSLYRTINHIYRFGEEKHNDENSAYCLVNIGKDTSIINIVAGNELKFPRFSNISIITFIDNVSKKINKNYAQVEQILDDYDFGKELDIEFDRNLAKEENDSDNDIQSDQSHAVSMALAEAGRQFINEINRSIDYFINQYSSYRIQKVILSGDIFRNFDRFVEKETGYKTESVDISSSFVLDPLEKKYYYKEKNLGLLGNQLILALGMTLRGFGL